MKKKYILLISLFFISFGVAVAQISFGVRGAVNMFNMTIKDKDDDKLDTKMVPTWNAGLFAEIPLGTEFALRPEINYAQKGYKIDEVNETTTRLSYVEIPLIFLYKGALSGGNVLIGFGPYIATGIGGKAKNGNTEDVKFKKDITLQESTQNVYYKPLDSGAKIYAGYELANGLSFTIETSLGLVNIMPQVAGNDNGDAKNVGFGLGIAYKIR